MGKVNNLPSAPPPPSLLADIIQARMNIKKKYSALKTGRFETESLVNNTLGSIIDPLNKIRDNIGTLRAHSSVHQPQSPPTSPTTTPSSAASTSRQSTQRSLPDVYKKHSAASSSSSLSSSPPLTTQYDLNELLGQWPTAGLDKVYAPKKSKSGEYVLGNKEIKFIDNEIHIEDDDDASFHPITPGLIELLFAKSPAAEKYTRDDLSVYKRILIQTSAHMTADGERIRTSVGAKYMKVISKLFKDRKSGSGINIRLQKHNIVYWNDPNELVDRLRLLYSSLAAGNTGVRNEIISICGELVEAGILKKIPNV
ncbi:unnamed protein product [Macrosiphum euphorbiae]|uniref:DUF8207 domain-containing protein n=1 Tax=Macrosiphum euphorbiae TaxID=13131 RepID=A0AAV0W7D3_9HEMI|nr:unnamed protein product [Macrosiphum euphorbiae]